VPDDLGPLAVALAKAQAEFGPITRDKKVIVKTKTGGQYEFSYAPLDQILNTVRAPLAKNGLTVVQLIDTDGLVTMLLHESGASLRGQTPLPDTSDIQGFGSAITYLRRYAIQALLGIAAEEDDDANRAAGNQVERKAPPAGEVEELLGIETKDGTAKAGQGATSSFDVRTTPDGVAFGFLLETAKGSVNVILQGDIAAAVLVAEQNEPKRLAGHWCRVKGRVYAVRQAQRRMTYRLRATEFETRDYKVPADTPPADGLFDDTTVHVDAVLDAAHEAELDAAMDEVPL
jgi:hypothetical protein